MQIDIFALQTVRTHAPSAGCGDMPGSRVADRGQRARCANGKENDFRANLAQAGDRLKERSPRPKRSDESFEQTEKQPTKETQPEALRQTERALEVADDGAPKAESAENEDTDLKDVAFRVGPVGMDATEAEGETGPADIDLGTEAAVAVIPEMAPPAEFESHAAEPSTALPLSSQAFAAAVDSPISTGDSSGSALPSAGLGQDVPEGMPADTTVKPSVSIVENTAEGEAAKADSDTSEKILPGKPLSENQKILFNSDPPVRNTDTPPSVHAPKPMTEEQSGAASLSKEAAEKPLPTFLVPEAARGAGDQNRKTAVDAPVGRFEVDRMERAAVDGDRIARTESAQAGQNDSRGNQEALNTSAARNTADVDQSAKLTDLFPHPQRPAAGEGGAPVATETLEARPGMPKTDLLNQIVDRAAFKLNNGHSEVRIDLKPDFLGHVRLQIVTENHQVNLRILAESPAVKELIDGNLGQLKSDLQAQGLKVDGIEVSVAKDFNNTDQRSNFAAHGDRGKRNFAFKDQDLPGSDGADGSRMALRSSSRLGGIDYFA